MTDYQPSGTNAGDTPPLAKAVGDTTSTQDALQRLFDDQYTRLAHRRVPYVLTLEPEPQVDEPKKALVLPPHGGVVLFVAKKGATPLQEIERAYSTRNYEQLRVLGEQLLAALPGSPLSVDAAADQILGEPVYFDVRYGGKTLASQVALINGLDVGSILFPYNGGYLRDEDFSVSEYYRPGHRAEYDYLVVKRSPFLSELEKKAVDAVPPHQLELNIATTPVNKFPVDFVRDIVREIARQAQRTVGCQPQEPGSIQELYRRAGELTLSPEVIQTLGAAASARELLNLRRQLLTDQWYRL